MPLKSSIFIAKLKKNNQDNDNENLSPDKFETKLSPEDEKKFQFWLDKNHKEGKIGKGDYDFYKKNGYGYDYDFRAAFKNGVKPSINPEDKQWHWSDFGKKPNEPTFSNESKYYSKLAKPGIGGYWKGEDFVKNPEIGAPVPISEETIKIMSKNK